MRKLIIFILCIGMTALFVHCAGSGGGVKNTFKQKVTNTVPGSAYISASKKIFDKFQFEIEIDQTETGGNMYLETRWKNRGLLPGERDMHILQTRIKLRIDARKISSGSFSNRGLNSEGVHMCKVEFLAYNEAIFAGSPEWQPLEVHPELKEYLQKVYGDLYADLQGVNVIR
ncbi:MAG: hypothetical protein GY863_09950 [bacterium]|nr:hypothetical protein [bacterium]